MSGELVKKLKENQYKVHNEANIKRQKENKKNYEEVCKLLEDLSKNPESKLGELKWEGKIRDSATVRVYDGPVKPNQYNIDRLSSEEGIKIVVNEQQCCMRYDYDYVVTVTWDDIPQI